MTGSAAGNGGAGVLDAIRELETTLQARAAAQLDADAELAAARSEAEHILATARERAEKRAADRRRLAVAVATADAELIGRDADQAAAGLRATLGAIEDEAIERALALLLPTPNEEATTCSPR